MVTSKDKNMTSRAIKFFIAIIILLFLIICGMTAYLVFTPGSQKSSSSVPVSSTTPPTTTATPAASSTELLSASVTVSSPKPNARVGKDFTVSGSAPNGWYFEAVFPIQIRDPNDDLIATTQGHAQSDWTVSGPVAFTAAISIDGNYSGPADLILLRDNPSGLPENSDEVTIPIVIKL